MITKKRATGATANSVYR